MREVILAGCLGTSTDPRYICLTEIETLLSDPTKTKQKLGWVPGFTVEKTCAETVAHELAKAK